MTTTAVAKREEVSLVKRFPANQYNVLSPVTIADSEASFLRVRAVEVPLAESDFYLTKGKYAPLKEALLKIAAAAGLILDPERTCEIIPVDRSRTENIAYRAVGAVLTDSGWRMMTSTYQWNYDVQKDKLKDDEFKQQLHNRWALAETKALNRLIRAICAVKQAYSKEDMAKPFVVVRTELNLEDPMVKAEVARRALSAGSAIFGTAPTTTRALPAGAPDFIEGEAEDVSGDDDEDDDNGRMVDHETGEITEPGDADGPPAEAAAQTAILACFECGGEVTDSARTWSRTEHGAEVTGGRDACTACGTALNEAWKKQRGAK